MGTLGSGCYGFNVLNANGETDQLPICRLAYSQSNTTGIVFFNEIVDDYHCAVPNQGANGGSYSSIRTPVSGVYEIEASLTYLGQGALGVMDASIYADKTLAITATGAPDYNHDAEAYVVATCRSSVLASTSQGTYLRKIIFLEKDVYLSLVTTTASGTAARQNVDTTANFTVRCVSTENSGKYSYQT
jgi:hypothetical protein